VEIVVDDEGWCILGPLASHMSQASGSQLEDSILLKPVSGFADAIKAEEAAPAPEPADQGESSSPSILVYALPCATAVACLSSCPSIPVLA
jgi:hypothetical protein